MTSEALATKVQAGIFAVVLDQNLRSQREAESFSSTSVQHDIDDPLHSTHLQLEVIELILENRKNMTHHLVKVSSTLS